jgi:hypothetical protein
MTLPYTTSDYPQILVVDRMIMRCLIPLTRPPHTYESDVAGPGATLNDVSILYYSVFAPR